MYKLLIAEDDFRIREAVRAFFSKRDFKVYEAAERFPAESRRSNQKGTKYI